MSHSSNPTFGFAANSTNAAISATLTPASRFPAGSANPSSGFPFPSTQPNLGFGSASTSMSAPAFGTPATNTPVFGTPTTKPPAFGTPSTNLPTFGAPTTKPPAFGTLSTNLPAFGASLGAPSTGSAQTGLFSGSFVSAAPAQGFGSLTTTTQSSSGLGGSQGTASTGLFSGSFVNKTTAQGFGSLTTTTQSSSGLSGTQGTASTGFFVGHNAAAAGTSLFSGYAPRSGTPAIGSSTGLEVKPTVGSSFATPGAGTKSGFMLGSGATSTPVASQTTSASGPIFGGQMASSGFTLGGTTATTLGAQGTNPQTGVGFKPGGTPGMTSQLGATTTGFKMGMTPATQSGSTMSATPGFTLGPGTTSQLGTTTTGLKLGSIATTQPGSTTSATPGFTLGGTPGTTAQPGATTTTGFKLGGTLATQPGATSTPGFTFATQATTQPVQSLALGQSSTGFNFTGQLAGQAKTIATTTASSTPRTSMSGSNTNLVFSAKVKSTTIPGALPSFTTTTSTAKPALAPTLPQTAKTTSVTAFVPTLPQTSKSTATTTTAATTTTTASAEKYTYKQLEEQVNKWNIELEEMEKAFLEQAAQVNVADRELMENGEKISVLNNEVERAKAEQNRLDQELDFLVSQQNELEDLLKPLEESVKQHGVEYAQEPDREREKIYTMAEKCDGQLKGMVQDLREIIDYLNASNANQQQDDNPIIQIAKILNVHMDSLQWIDQNSALLQKRVEEISRLSEMRRKEHERSFRLGFD